MKRGEERNQLLIVEPNGSWKSLGLFFVLTFGWTWAFMIPAVTLVPDKFRTILIIFAAFGPFLAAVTTIRIFEGRDKLNGWLRSIFRIRIPILLYLAGAFLIPILIGSLQYLIYWILGGTPGFHDAQPWYLYLFSLIPTALLTGGNEEPGWRGYALRILNKLTSPLLAGLILGVVHSLWHLPLMSRYQTNILWYSFNLIPLTYLFNWFYNKSHASIWPVMLFHAGTNVIGSYIPTPVNVLGITGDFMVLRGIVYWIMTIILMVFIWKPWIKEDLLIKDATGTSIVS